MNEFDTELAESLVASAARADCSASEKTQKLRVERSIRRTPSWGNHGLADPMIKTHVSINVSDVARSTEFYKQFFGIGPHKVRPGYANFDVANPPLKLALMEKTPFAKDGVLNHLGLLVEDTKTVLAIRERLQASGVPLVDEMGSNCCYATQDKIWVHDPDGTAWEVYALTDDQIEPMTVSLGASTQASCCVPGGDGAKCC